MKGVVNSLSVHFIFMVSASSEVCVRVCWGGGANETRMTNRVDLESSREVLVAFYVVFEYVVDIRLRVKGLGAT